MDLKILDAPHADALQLTGIYREVDWAHFYVSLVTAPFPILLLIAPWYISSDIPSGGAIVLSLICAGFLATCPLCMARRFLKAWRKDVWRLGWTNKGIYCSFNNVRKWNTAKTATNTAFIPRNNIDWIALRNVSLEDISSEQTSYLEIGLKRLDLSLLHEALKMEEINQADASHPAPPSLQISEEGTLLIAVKEAQHLLVQLSQSFPVLFSALNPEFTAK